MTIQGLEMQRATLMAFQQMSQTSQAAAAEAENAPNPFLNPATWQIPWDFMKSAVQGNAAGAADAVPPAPTSEPAGKPERSPRKKSQPQG